MTRRSCIAGICTAFAIFASPARAQTPEQIDFWQRQMEGLERAVSSTSVNSRVRNVWLQLVRHSGLMLPVVPAQNFNLGQALPSGIVLLDLSVAGDAQVEVTAWTMAHEYGHQALHHPQMMLTQFGQWLAASAGTAQEDAADRYAGGFLRRFGYRIEPVLSFLCELPGGGAGDAHSSGPERARTVARAYGRGSGDPCESTKESESYDVSLRMWSRSEGNPTTMSVAVDGDDVGTLSNLQRTESIDIGPLEAGSHTLTISDIVLYGPLPPYGQIGVVASGLECSTTFRITRGARLRLAARLMPTGEVVCAVR